MSLTIKVTNTENGIVEFKSINEDSSLDLDYLRDSWGIYRCMGGPHGEIWSRFEDSGITSTHTLKYLLTITFELINQDLTSDIPDFIFELVGDSHD